MLPVVEIRKSVNYDSTKSVECARYTDLPSPVSEE
jgi:hypothetical protein